MKPPSEGWAPINLFSLVAYIPDPLGSFLDRLRQEFVPACNLKAHVTILPPRPMSADVEGATDLVRSRIRELSPFEVRLTDVEVFSMTSVVYLSVGTGFSDLCQMHEILNVNGLHFKEPYPYHPHITVAQQMAPEQVEGVYELARRRWAEFGYDRSFKVEAVTFVQGTNTGEWIDLAGYPIGTLASTPKK